MWAWFAIFGLGAVNEWVQRTKSVKAQTVLQAAGDVLKRTPIYFVPVLRQIIDQMSTQAAPAISPPDNATKIDLGGGK